MDPLAQLKDIHLPAAVNNYPIAPGWWLLAIIVLALIIYGLVKCRQYLVKRKHKKAALAQLSAKAEIGTIVALLKWAALQYFPRQAVANLTGYEFKDFLVASLPVKHQENFTELSGQYFISAYEEQTTSQSSAEFYQAAKLWLTHALPPQQNLTTESVSSATAAKTSEHSEQAEVTVDKQVDDNDGVKS